MSKQTVLVPLDGSDFGAQIIAPALSLLSPGHHRIVLLHVCAPPRPHPVHDAFESADPHDAPGSVTVPERIRMPYEVVTDSDVDAAAAEAVQGMAPARATFEAAGFEVRTEVAFGAPAEAIERIVASDAIDLIAMTTHGRSGLTRMIAGSVAGHVLRHVRVPVLMLRPESPQRDLYTTDEMLKFT
ncbi:MAG: universal stress protein [Chloroflexi bacterium]|nr:universal stress protein [Chloroflexota bacterium]